jgi:hypothetical protein
MAPLLAARVWHYWISVFLFVPTVLITIGVFVAYVIKVVAPKYTRR